MELGVFTPSAHSGWLVTTESPTRTVDFEHVKASVIAAENAGLEFALTMVKFRGFGGQSHFWESALESFTLTAALAPVTERIRLFASNGVLALPPVYAAQMALTIDNVAPGRFGVNIVSGWQRAEYEQMGVWPGDDHYQQRYDYCSEYVEIMRRLWEDGTCDYTGKFFEIKQARLAFEPPHKSFEIVCAGQSERGMRFCAEHGDYNFILGVGLNTPTAFKTLNEQLLRAADVAGRDVGSIPTFFLVGGDTEQEAFARWRHYVDNADQEALAWLLGQASLDKHAKEGATTKTVTLPERAVCLNFGVLIGSYEDLAHMLDEVAAVPGTKGIMLAFDEHPTGLSWFAERVQPAMDCRRGVVEAR